MLLDKSSVEFVLLFMFGCYHNLLFVIFFLSVYCLCMLLHVFFGFASAAEEYANEMLIRFSHCVHYIHLVFGRKVPQSISSCSQTQETHIWTFEMLTFPILYFLGFFFLLFEIPFLFVRYVKTAWLIQTMKPKESQTVDFILLLMFYLIVLRTVALLWCIFFSLPFCLCYFILFFVGIKNLKIVNNNGGWAKKSQEKPFSIEFWNIQHIAACLFLGYVVFNFLLHYARKELVNCDEMQIM